MTVMISDKSLQLIKLMADGECHSGEELGAIIGVSRAAVWKTLKGVAQLGVHVSRTRGKGYCIDGGINLLDVSKVLNCCGNDIRQFFDEIEIFPIIDSTNRYLLDKLDISSCKRSQRVCLAEMQASGRGRRGRDWQSPFARNIYLSLSWQFQGGVVAMEGLSLALGVAAAESLEALGCKHISLKWPNDILVGNAKLGGILIEIVGDASGLCHAVVGMGVNVDMPANVGANIDQPWTDLKSIMSQVPERNEIIGVMLKRFAELLSVYETVGFGDYRARWESRNACRNKRVFLSAPSISIDGVMRGVSKSGAAQIDVNGTLEEFIGGEISLRQVE